MWQQGYIQQRLQELHSKKYRVKVLLVLIDVPQADDTLKLLAKLCVTFNFSLVAAFSATEAGRCA
jgi:DNA repair protein Rad10